MSMFVLIALVAAEVALVWMTCSKWSEKPDWRRNRALVRLIETTLVFGIVLLPTTHMKWRFLIALAVLIVRFLIAGISWLARRKKTGTRKKGWTVVNCVFSVILIVFTLIPSFVFSNYNGLPTTGEYTVNEVSGILVDSSRKDPFENDGSDREVPVHFYYPETDAGSNAFPLIFFSHGAFGYYQSNYSTYMELASHGYVVVALDHPHHSFFTKDTAGKTVIVDSSFINDVMGINEEGVTNEQIFNLSQEWLKIRLADEAFALDCMERAKMRRSLDAAWHTEPVRTAAWCVLPTCVTYFRKEPDLRQYLLRLVLQLILIQAEVILLIAPPADGSVSPVRFYGTLGVTVFVIYAAVMLMFWLQKVRQSRKLTQQLIHFQNGQTE